MPHDNPTATVADATGRSADVPHTGCNSPYAGLTEYELRHLPSHLGTLAYWEDLQGLVIDLEFEQTRLGALPGSGPAAVGIYDVLRDFTDALAILPAEDPGRPAVEVLYRVLDQQAHLLHEHPRWFVQQLANACDWDETVLAERAARPMPRSPASVGCRFFF
jgi:hypothetical protein